MKSWRKPEAVGQEFAANEYVSACTVTVSCDFWPEGHPTTRDRQDIHLNIPQDVYHYRYYIPCGASYEATQVNVNELKPVLFTTDWDNVPVESGNAYYWIEYKEDGSTDFHVSSITADELAAANMS